ncbi:MAG: transposase, partial [Rhodoluna sp.]
MAVIAETMQPGMSISYVARRHGLSPRRDLLWKRLMNDGGREAVRVDDEVVASYELRRLEDRVRDLERMLGLKILEQPLPHVDREQEALEAIRFAEKIGHGVSSRATDNNGFTPSLSRQPRENRPDRSSPRPGSKPVTGSPSIP